MLDLSSPESLQQFEKQLIETARELPQRFKIAEDLTANQKVTAKKLLQTETTCATACFKAAKLLLGETFRAWEPESIWITLEKLGVTTPLVNRDKLLATTTLTMIPAFWWEVHAFENTVMAFNNELSDPQTLQEPLPGQIAWGVYEAEMLHQHFGDIDDEPEFDHEPKSYTAVVLHRAGFVLAPNLLEFAQEELNYLNKSGAAVNPNAVEKAWDQLKTQNLSSLKIPEDDALNIQLGRLLGVQLYVNDRLKAYRSDLNQLR